MWCSVASAQHFTATCSQIMRQYSTKLAVSEPNHSHRPLVLITRERSNLLRLLGPFVGLVVHAGVPACNHILLRTVRQPLDQVYKCVDCKHLEVTHWMYSRSMSHPTCVAAPFSAPLAVRTAWVRTFWIFPVHKGERQVVIGMVPIRYFLDGKRVSTAELLVECVHVVSVLQENDQLSSPPRPMPV